MTEPLIRFHGDPPTHLTFLALEALGVPHLSTTRHCRGIILQGEQITVSPEVLDLLSDSAVEPKRLSFAHQVHGARVLCVDGSSQGVVGRGDVLLTSTPGIPLAVFTADCLSLILFDENRRHLALSHAGWRGTIAGAARAAVEAMVAAGSSPSDVTAAIFPSIGPCCYEVDGPVIDSFERAFPQAWESWVRAVGPGRWMLDLWQANEFQLTAEGMRPKRILNPRLCTACHRDLFFSYRKEGQTGRLATLVSLPVNPERSLGRSNSSGFGASPRTA